MTTSLQQLGRYQIESLLGVGAFAEVYKATDSLLKRTVALKVLKPALLADPDAFARFLQEAQSAASLFHSGIATMLDMGEADGRYFLAMRYVDGLSLAELIEQRGALSWEESLGILRQAAAALDFAHRRGLVHCDIKPGNILVSPSEGAVLTDFGLVRAMESSGLSTRTGSILGTPQYIPPEIWKGKPVTPQSDQYALACVLVEMLSGQVLFEGPTPWAIMAAHAALPVLPENWPPEAPGNLKETMLRALAQEPGERFDSCTQWVEVLNKKQLANKGKVVASDSFSQVKSEEITVPDYDLGYISGSMLKEQEHEITREQECESPGKLTQATLVEKQGNEMTITLAEGVQMVFVRIPAGEFWMGSSDDDPDASGDEKPLHKVSLDRYWIGKYQVTNTQYLVYMQARKMGDFEFLIGHENNPVVNISWYNALAFCHWLSELSGEAIRLPTEAEWEKAARGTDKRLYPWGNQSPSKSLANYGWFIPKTLPGWFSPQGDSPYGCADMAGNVWEWVSDWYAEDYYALSPGSNPQGPQNGYYRVMRGGFRNNQSKVLRAAYRYWKYPEGRDDSIGFRCAGEF